MKKIIVRIPRNFMNVGISTDNKLTADTNDHNKWDMVIFPLPRGRWSIYCYEFDRMQQLVILVDKRNFLQRLFNL